MTGVLLTRMCPILRSFSFVLRTQRNASWTPLAKAFNYLPSDVIYSTAFDNPKGLFEYRQLRDHECLLGMKLKALDEKDVLLIECLDPNRKRKVVQIMDDLSDTLCRIADLCEFIRIMHPDTHMHFESQEICVELGRIIEELNTNKELYNKVKEVAECGDIYPMTEVEKHVMNLFVFDFELNGIHLPEKDRQQVVQYNDLILQLGQTFKQNAERPRLLSAGSIPPVLSQYFQTTNEGHLIVTGYANITDEHAREHAYKVYLAGNRVQEEVLDQILTYRHLLAQKCGFPTYAHRAIKGGIAENPSFVIEFLNKLNESVRDAVKRDFDLMRSVKAAESDRPLAMWDVSHIISKIKRDSLAFELKEYVPYFSLGSCMDGLNLLTRQLFGITLEDDSIDRSELWTPELHKLKVVHQTEGLLGHIYCDFFEREDKPKQDCHFTIKGGRRCRDGSYQNPVVVIVLSLPTPTRFTPSLLTPEMVENLFHEMGHALHSMLGRTEYQHITGTRTATDFAEVPSILMEYFFTDKRVLKSFARHYKSGDPMPDKLIERLCRSRKICVASELQTQIFYSALDHTLHTDNNVAGRTNEIYMQTQEKYYPLSYVENTAWHLQFSHLIGYGAKYYSYLMSRSIASIIWQKCFKQNPFDGKMGEKYRSQCLSHGGGKPPRLLVEDFLDIKVTPAELTKSLVDEIESSYQEV